MPSDRFLDELAGKMTPVKPPRASRGVLVIELIGALELGLSPPEADVISDCNRWAADI